jgi:hypothetical protein
MPKLSRQRRICVNLDAEGSSEIDEVAPREWTSGLLQPATREKAAEVDGFKSEARNRPLGELFRFRVVSRRKSLDGRREANSRPIALPLAALTRGPGNGAFAPLSASVPLPTRSGRPPISALRQLLRVEEAAELMTLRETRR